MESNLAPRWGQTLDFADFICMPFSCTQLLFHMIPPTGVVVVKAGFDREGAHLRGRLFHCQLWNIHASRDL